MIIFPPNKCLCGILCKLINILCELIGILCELISILCQPISILFEFIIIVLIVFTYVPKCHFLFSISSIQFL